MCFFCFKGNFTPNQLEQCRNLVSPAGSAMQAVPRKQHFSAGSHVSSAAATRFAGGCSFLGTTVGFMQGSVHTPHQRAGSI